MEPLERPEGGGLALVRGTDGGEPRGSPRWQRLVRQPKGDLGLGCGGVGHADGDTWNGYPRYLEDLCVDAIDITDDGSVWALAGKRSQEEENAGPRSVYVIIPKAVAGTE